MSDAYPPAETREDMLRELTAMRWHDADRFFEFQKPILKALMDDGLVRTRMAKRGLLDAIQIGLTIEGWKAEKPVDTPVLKTPNQESA